MENTERIYIDKVIKWFNQRFNNHTRINMLIKKIMKFDNIVAISTIYTMHFEQYSNKKITSNCKVHTQITWCCWANVEAMLSTLLGQRWEHNVGPPLWAFVCTTCWANVVYRTTTVGPLLSQHCHFRWANVGSTSLAHCLTTLWAFFGPTCWANVVYRITTVGPFLGQRCHFCWANVGSTLLAHCLTALWTFIGPTGCLYGRVIILQTLRRPDNMSLVEIQQWFNIAWPTKPINKLMYTHIWEYASPLIVWFTCALIWVSIHFD